jgi:nicotinate phosphoribosyltransferase
VNDHQRPESPARAALFTDLYELTMAQAYLAEGMEGPAVFELFFRELPPTRGYFLAAGLEQVLDYLECWRFTAGDREYLAGQGQFSEWFLDRLMDLSFTGEVWALPEGTPVFPGEPLVQVVAPLAEAQLVETLVLNQVHFQTIAATKASRVVQAAGGRAVVDFGSRRAHGLDAALKVGRVCYLAGCAGTSNVQAGKEYGVPVFGTMAHSYVQAHDRERQALEAFARQYPETTLLVDTYDTLEGVDLVIDLASRLGEDFRVRAVRLDSGDLAELAAAARAKLDGAGLERVKIFASSGLDEHKISQLLAAGAPIDGFGVGTRLAVSPDATDLDMAYKLVAYDGRGRMKLSSDKLIHPGRKQVFRREDNGALAGDTVGRFDETLEGEPLLRRVMAGGRRTDHGRESLEEMRSRAARERERLPRGVRALRDPAPYPVEMSPGLQADLESLRRELEAGH